MDPSSPIRQSERPSSSKGMLVSNMITRHWQLFTHNLVCARLPSSLTTESLQGTCIEEMQAPHN